MNKLSESSLPRATVIVVNYNGREHLADCFSSLASLLYPWDTLEVIMVDNGSSDGSVEFVKRHFPQVKLIQNDRNLGFARASNIGIAHASGEYVAFLNNDMWVDPHWLIELVKPVLRDQDVVCTASKILSWDGKRIDFVGGALNFYGHGFQLDYGKSNIADYTLEKLLLFACGGAMLMDKEVFLECGGFDEDYFAFFEDVDLGWRLWILGYKVLFAPKAIAYHKGHGTVGKVSDHRRRVLYERNALYTIIKNYEKDNLERILPAALLLTAKKALIYSRIDRNDYALNIESGKPRDIEMEKIPRMGISHLVALNEVADNIDRVFKKRQEIQGRRVRSDAEILPLFEQPFTPNCLDEGYFKAQATLARLFGVDQLFSSSVGNEGAFGLGGSPKRALLISNDVIGERMAGPGIRFWEFAKALSKDHKVTLTVPNRNPPMASGFEVCTYTRKGRELQELARSADVIVFQGFVLHFYPFLKELAVPLVVDLYDPFVLENIQAHSHNRSMGERMMVHRSDLDVLNDQLKAGDFFICASEKQRDFWIGMLLALGRVNPCTYDDDETLRRLIDVVPFGIPSQPPRHIKRVLKGVYKTIREEDKVILWGGGIWDWFDPCTLIRAMAQIVKRRDDVKLFFMGVKHPNPSIPQMRATTQAIQLSKDLGLHDRFVFFNDWVPYKERQNYLLEADVGISLHLDHIETRLSFRTRILDYIWAGLPIVTTKGDSMSELVERYNLGRVVDYEDVGQVTEALLELLDTPNLRENLRPNFERVAGLFTWEEAIEPLADFCANPRFAPDKVRQMEPFTPVKPTPWWALPGRAWQILKEKGADALWREIKSYIRWRLIMYGR